MSAPRTDAQATPRLGLSGRIARAFLTSEITPLLALCGLLLGLLAVLITAREEEPQIDVTMANVFVAMPGASAREVESLITTPAERIAAEIEGVEHIYSVSTPGMAQLTVRFAVGEPRNSAIVRLYNAFYSNQDWLPRDLQNRWSYFGLFPNAVIAVTRVATEALSRDHLNVAVPLGPPS